jgi:mannobiose 2-epimerase
MNTLLIYDKYYPQDGHRYFDKFKQLWGYVQTYLIDTVNGDWYQGGLDKQPRYKTALKGQIWKGTYHTLRGFINCIQSLQPDSLPPLPPVDLKLNQTHNKTLLTWKDHTAGNAFFGYNLYIDRKRTWYTPLTAMDVSAYSGKNISITAVDQYGNESRQSKQLLLQ